MQIDAPSVEEYYKAKEEVTRRKEDVILDKSKWWANGNIMCNVVRGRLGCAL